MTSSTDVSQIVEKMPYLAMLKNPFKNLWIVHRYSCGKIFVKIGSVVFFTESC